MKLYWSHKLEDLADRLYEDVAAQRGDDPFAQSCVVVGNQLRGDWLREYRLFDNRDARRPVLANLNIHTLHPFVGDWLYAALERVDPKSRQPSSHPYSKDVLQWRIDAILARDAAEFPTLDNYLGNDTDAIPARRFALAGKIAEIFDNYQTHRPEMLSRWDRGEVPAEPVAKWQAELWRKLREQAPAGEPLTEQFLKVAREKVDLAEAFAHGIPRYRSIHVFGISSMPRPYVSFFDRLSRIVPVFVYAFNPSAEFWFDDPSWARARREVVEEERTKALRSINEALDRGEAPDLLPLRERLAEKSHPILGSLATGCQGLLAELLDRLDGDREELGASPDGVSLLARLQRQLLDRRDNTELEHPVAADDSSFTVHLASTPRREMEVLRDGLLNWFSKHPEARPRDAIVLCADWDKYAPHIDAVFGAAKKDEWPTIPFSMVGRGAARDSVATSFLSLLELSGGRFEADVVLDALSVPAVAEKFGIAESDFPTLREFVRTANIRWGLDDEQVEEVMRDARAASPAADEADTSPFAFTWRRGLDRLLLSALCGTLDAAPEGLAQEGSLGEIRPTGDAESERAKLVGCLASFVDRLSRLRALRREVRTASFWQGQFLDMIAGLYARNDDTGRSIADLRGAVTTVCARMREADAAVGGIESSHPFAVVAAAISERVRDALPGPVRTPDAVLFAPLRAGVASPRRLVWVCGLDDGVFPRNEFPPAFDLMGSHPAPLDPSPRADDALALLEALCAAREAFVVSYKGISPRTGEEVPPAPLLGALEDYLKSRFVREGAAIGVPPYLLYKHPLQAFSPQYFAKDTKSGGHLPASFSVSAFKTAAALATSRAEKPETPKPFVFLTEDEIDLDTFVKAFTDPCGLVIGRMARVPNPKYDNLETDDGLEDADLAPWDLLFLSRKREFSAEEAAVRGRVDCERGRAARPEGAAAAYLANWEDERRAAFRERTVAKIAKTAPVPISGKDGALDLLDACDAAEPLLVKLDLAVPKPGGEKRNVRVSGTIRAVSRPIETNGSRLFRVVLDNGLVKPARMAGNWLRHLAANAAGLELVTIVLSGLGGDNEGAKDVIQGFAPIPTAEAKDRLAKLMAILATPHPGGIPFHPQSSFDLAGWKTQPDDGTTDGILRKPFEKQRNRTGVVPPPPAESTLWPAPNGTPASLDDAGKNEWWNTAHLFWDGCPHLQKHRNRQ